MHHHKNVFQEAFQQWTKYWEWCITSKGDYFAECSTQNVVKWTIKSLWQKFSLFLNTLCRLALNSLESAPRLPQGLFRNNFVLQVWIQQLTLLYLTRSVFWYCYSIYSPHEAPLLDHQRFNNICDSRTQEQNTPDYICKFPMNHSNVQILTFYVCWWIIFWSVCSYDHHFYFIHIKHFTNCLLILTQQLKTFFHVLFISRELVAWALLTLSNSLSMCT